MKTTELEEIVKKMRELGVHTLKFDATEIILGPVTKLDTEPHEETRLSTERGADGLSKLEQELLYGTSLDDFKE
jgi:hypothetical protein